MHDSVRKLQRWATTTGAIRVPEVAAAFWVTKALSTAMGESASDYLVHVLPPVVAVLLGFAGFVAALIVQFRTARYRAWTYWLAVAMVGVFGTMAADVLHVALDVPYVWSTVLYVIVLAAVFVIWDRVEHSLSMHGIDTPRREAFYWAAVVATFAMGTALGDLTAYTLHLGYWPSALLFAVLIPLPAIAHRWHRLGSVATFWMTYVLTRPLGASIADGLGKPRADRGLGLGGGVVTLVFVALIVAMVVYLSVTRSDEPNRDGRATEG